MDNPIWLSDTEFVDVCKHIRLGARDAKGDSCAQIGPSGTLLIFCKDCDKTYEFTVLMG